MAARGVYGRLVIAVAAALTAPGLVRGATITVFGNNGLAGGPGQVGGAGGAAFAQATAPNTSSNQAFAYGGSGGKGGGGITPGIGGKGGDATARALVNDPSSYFLLAKAEAQGGSGGPGGEGGNPATFGLAGVADARAEGTLSQSFSFLEISAAAYGGSYSASSLTDGRDGQLGKAQLILKSGSGALSSFTWGTVYAAGGYGQSASYFQGAVGHGGRGGAAVAQMSLDMAASTLEDIDVSAYGGAGGTGIGSSKRGGDGGTAQVVMGSPLTKSSGSVTLSIVQQAGEGGSGLLGAGGGNGAMSVMTNSFTFASSVAATINQVATGGAGGSTYADGFTYGPAVGTPGHGGAGKSLLAISSSGAISAQSISYGGAGGSRYGTGDGVDGSMAHSTVQAVGKSLQAYALAIAGNGGNGGGVIDGGGTVQVFAGSGGEGGSATAGGSVQAFSGTLYASFSAYGGSGGKGYGVGETGGDGGQVIFDPITVNVPASQTGGVNVTGVGGNGGAGLFGANGGQGAGVSLSNEVALNVAGTSKVTVDQGAYAGDGGESSGGVPGMGGFASSVLTLSTNTDQLTTGRASAYGGAGGGGSGATAGRLGSSGAVTVSVAGVGPTEVAAFVGGGNGGATDGAAHAGHGGAAGSVSAFGSSSTAEVYVEATVSGGHGGNANGTGDAGHGGEGHISNAVSGSSPVQLSLTQYANGGNGGDAAAGAPGSGGAGISELSVIQSVPLLTISTSAVGGNSGMMLAQTMAPVTGGSAHSASRVENAGGESRGFSYSQAGRGSSGGAVGGVGGSAISLSDARSITAGSVASVEASATSYGGQGGVPNAVYVGHQTGGGGLAQADAWAVGTGGAFHVTSSATASGGNGGDSGSGSSLSNSDETLAVNVGPGGHGGEAIAHSVADGGQLTSSTATATGGRGGVGSMPGRGGRAEANAVVLSSAGSVSYSSAYAYGGQTSRGGHSGDALAAASREAGASIGTLRAEAVTSSPYAIVQGVSSISGLSAQGLTRNEVRVRPDEAVDLSLNGDVSGKHVLLPAETQIADLAGTSAQSFFGDGSGVLAIGAIRVSDVMAGSHASANVRLHFADASAFRGLAVSIGLYDVSGVSNGGNASVSLSLYEDGAWRYGQSVSSPTTAAAMLNGTTISLADSHFYFGGDLELGLDLTGDGGNSLSLRYVIGFQPVANQWKGGGGSVSWNESGNWSSKFSPNAAGQTAIFNTRYTSAGPVMVEGVTRLGRLTLDPGETSDSSWDFIAGYQETSARLFRMEQPAGVSDPARIELVRGGSRVYVPVELAVSTEVLTDQPDSVLGMYGGVTGIGNLVKKGSGKLVLGGPLTFSGALEVSGGEVELLSPRDVATQSTSIAAGATLRINVSPSAGSHSSVVVIGQDQIVMGGTSNLPAMMKVEASHTELGLNPNLVVVNEIAMGLDVTGRPVGMIDLTDNAMLVSGMSEEAIRFLVGSWWNGGGRDGMGLGTSLAGIGGDGNELTTLAVCVNRDSVGESLMEAFYGEPAAGSDVLVMYTYIGDTDLNGLVNQDDLAVVLEGVRLGLTGWQHGDTNYDGVVDGNDLANVVRMIRVQQVPFKNPRFVMSSSDVPEPILLGPVVAAFLPLARRRRM